MENPLPAPLLPTLTRTDFFRLVGTSIGVIALANSVSACGTDGTDPAPSMAVDFTVNWGQSPYSNLKSKGGYFVEKGVIVAQTQTGSFVAVSSRCPHEGTTLVFQNNNNRFYCPLHQSAFSTAGVVQNGPATVEPETIHRLGQLRPRATCG